MRRREFAWRAGLTAAVVLTLLTGPAWGRTIEKRSFEGDTVEVQNLIGAIRVEGHGGSGFAVEIDIQGQDSTDVPVRIDSDGSSLTLVFPRAERYVYPELGAGSRSSFSMNDGDSGGWLSRVLDEALRRGRIEVAGSGTGLEVWADLTIKVPQGGRLAVRHGVGHVSAEDVDGELDLAVRSGHVDAGGVRGALSVDTGSGHVNVGHVSGDVLIDTGSGHVEVRGVDGAKLDVDTGSGHVDLEDVRSSSVRVDTGSGRVEAKAISANGIEIDTGSGGVSLQLDAIGDGGILIDTGSGRVDLRIPADASLDVRASTGSGGIDLDLDTPVQLRRKDRDEVSFTIGGGGAKVRLDTGSGGIRISN